MSRLSVRNLHAVQSRREVVTAASLEVAPGEMVAVVGANGAGKTTLLRAATGLHPISRGESRLDGEPIHRLNAVERAMKLGYLPQERRVAWGLEAIEVAALGAPLEPPSVARERARQALSLFGVEALAEASVFSLSGGERARVLLARLFATHAPLLVADEPAAGLDPDAQLLCLERLSQHAKAGGAVLVTLHDLELAARFADRIVVLRDGAVVADGPPLTALSPAVLKSAFGLRARWIEADGERMLSARRL